MLDVVRFANVKFTGVPDAPPTLCEPPVPFKFIVPEKVYGALAEPVFTFPLTFHVPPRVAPEPFKFRFCPNAVVATRNKANRAVKPRPMNCNVFMTLLLFEMVL